jgi:hypothetical protein
MSAISSETTSQPSSAKRVDRKNNGKIKSHKPGSDLPRREFNFQETFIMLQITQGKTDYRGKFIPAGINFSLGGPGSHAEIETKYNSLIRELITAAKSTPEYLEFTAVQARLQKAQAELSAAQSRIERLKSQIEKASIDGDDDSKLQSELADVSASLVGLRSRLAGVESIIGERRSAAFLAAREIARSQGSKLEKLIRVEYAQALKTANDELLVALNTHLNRLDALAQFKEKDFSTGQGSLNFTEKFVLAQVKRA